MNNYWYIVLAIIFVTAQPALAGDSMGHSAQGSKHASQAVGHSAAGASKLTSGIVAVPLMAVGEVGKGLGSVGDSMWDEANTPLPISEEAVTAGPPPSVPDKSMKANQPPSVPGDK